ncbi:MAG: host-nuclease inhibitor Gam family protein [Clostridia bacterium]|nr:host-nuclease inhibitor Gam family protein [Clostridia bacterium]
MGKTGKIQAWDEVAISLKEIAEINVRINAAEVSMNNAIAEIKSKYEEKVRPDMERKAELEGEIKEWTSSKKGDFVDKKSKEFTFGKVGFRKSTEIVTRNIRAIIEALKAHNMTDCIIVSERIDKEALGKYDDTALKAVGARRKEGEKYFLEIYEESLK